LKRSLSALFPVRNEETTLRQTVAEWLEVLSELTPRLELIIVDDCSLDSTIEVADNIASQYPQARAIRLPQPSGRAAALRRAFEVSCGEIVFLADEGADLSLWQVRKMWHALEESEAVVAKPPLRTGGKCSPWKRLAAKSRGGFVLARRGAIRPWIDALENSALLGGRLLELGTACREIELGVRKPHIAAQRWAAQAKSVFAPQGGCPTLDALHSRQTARAEAPAAARGEPKRPNYLKMVRDFATGE
jgi:glycosyltransferase involved in cell wall biosynthesis